MLYSELILAGRIAFDAANLITRTRTHVSSKVVPEAGRRIRHATMVGHGLQTPHYHFKAKTLLLSTLRDPDAGGVGVVGCLSIVIPTSRATSLLPSPIESEMIDHSSFHVHSCLFQALLILQRRRSVNFGLRLRSRGHIEFALPRSLASYCLHFPLQKSARRIIMRS